MRIGLEGRPISPTFAAVVIARGHQTPPSGKIGSGLLFTNQIATAAPTKALPNIRVNCFLFAAVKACW